MERAGPSKRSVSAVSLALLPTTRCRSLHRSVSRSFWRGSAAALAVAMPESDREVTAMLSRAAERVGLEWRNPPCPEPSRLDDWFLGVACAGSQRPAPGASLPDVHHHFGENTVYETRLCLEVEPVHRMVLFSQRRPQEVPDQSRTVLFAATVGAKAVSLHP